MRRSRWKSAMRRRWEQGKSEEVDGEEEGRIHSMRVGYVNVQGWTPGKWEVCRRLIQQGSFDLLFIAETWYMGYPRYSRWQGTIAATPRPEVRRGSRHSGGLCVLGSPALMARVVGDPEVTEAAITMRVGRYQVSGIYFPPSMRVEDMAATLALLPSSDLVLGDFNTTFGHYPGDGRPLERVALLSTWLQTADLTPLSPCLRNCPVAGAGLGTKTTIDHVFIRRSRSPCRLHLLDTKSLRLPTDHRHLLSVSISDAGKGVPHSPEPCRFWIHRLSRPDVVQSLVSCWRRKTSVSAVIEDLSVDVRHRRLVELCQIVCEEVLGRVHPRRVDGGDQCRRQHGSELALDLTAMATHRLMKQAMASDRDNKPLLPLEPGGDALAETAEMFRQRYMGTKESIWEQCEADDSNALPAPSSPFSRTNIIAEVKRREAGKACAADGIHIRVLKALVETSLIDMLHQLFEACWEQGVTPEAWNRADICLVIKDKQQPKTPANVRPITLICLFRKIFEAILLRVFDGAGDTWAEVHPTQAGFRRTYSTLTQAATLHALFEMGLIESVVFLDFRAAFDVIDHDRLLEVLRRRRCPTRVLALIFALTCRRVCSRVLANDQTSDWFSRTRGVLQGSPLSPYLFNLFVDGLLRRLNEHGGTVPRALFYADDGALLGTPGMQMQRLVDVVVAWSVENGIELNARKCGHLSTRVDQPQLFAGKDEIPSQQQYTYLGFPVSITLRKGRRVGGIDWLGHLRSRLQAANRRAQFLALFSAAWGPLHRLRVFLQYLAPMFEYGAPLVYAWFASHRPASTLWKGVMADWKELICWIAGGTKSWHVATNLCGLLPLEDRFHILHGSFQYQLDRLAPPTPLYQLRSRGMPTSSFLVALYRSPIYLMWKVGRSFEGCTKVSLMASLDQWKQEYLRRGAEASHLTRIIPFDTRQSRGMRYADITLAAPLEVQDLLFQYRRGSFAVHCTHKCAFCDRKFHRGDEECPCFGVLTCLSLRRQKERLALKQRLSPDGLFTVVDYWLAVQRLDRAGRILLRVNQSLRRQYSAACFQGTHAA